MACIELRTSRYADRVALRGVRLVARLAGMSLKATVEQTFVNRKNQAIEAVYTFPLPDGAAVCGFQVHTADRVWVGQIEEKEAAIEAYDKAIESGEGAFMAEQDRPDVFNVRVGNLKPGQSALVRIEYVCALETVDRVIRVAFPTTVAPRYLSAAGMDPIDAAIDGDALNPAHLLQVPYGLSAEIEIDLGRTVRAITSPSHPIVVSETESPGSYRVTLAGAIAEMDRDLVLAIELQKEAAPAVQIATGEEGESYVSISFVPEFDLDTLHRRPTETVFVLDCSGSMNGDSIAQATTALALCLRSLGEEDTFNVCRFGSRFELLSPEPLAYSQQTLDLALKWINRGADLGGTELHAPLQRHLRDGHATRRGPPAHPADRRAGYQRAGPVESRAKAPAQPSHLLLWHRARLQHPSRPRPGPRDGRLRRIHHPGERIEEKVLRTFSRIASPTLSEVSIDWHNADVQTLSELPPIFDGDVFNIIGRVSGRVPEEVTLHCRTESEPVSWKLAVPRHAPREADHLLRTMWARRAIQSIEEINDIRNHHNAASSLATRDRAALIDLSRRYGVLSVLTNFIAVEHRSIEERTEGQPALRRIPVMLARGWGGVELTMDRTIQRSRGGAIPMSKLYRLSDSMSPTAPAAAQGGSGLMDLCREADDSDLGAVLDEIAPGAGNISKRAEVQEDVRPNPLLGLLVQQSADGSFDLDGPRQALTLLRDLDSAAVMAKLESLFPASIPEFTRNSAIETAIAILLMETQYADRERLWRRARDKSLHYLARVSGRKVEEIRTAIAELAVKK